MTIGSGARSPYIDGMMRVIRSARSVLAAAAAVAGLVLLPSCGSSTDPDGHGEIAIAYTPSAPAVTLTAGATLDLHVTVTGASAVGAAWTLDGAPVGTGLDYTYTAAFVGVDTVEVAVSADDVLGHRSWIMTVLADQTQLPPAVYATTVGHGTEPVQVTMTWLRATATHFPIVDYVVAVNFTEPVTTANWEQSVLLGAVPHDPNLLVHRATFGEADGLVPGATGWFAVRTRDSLGQLSAIRDIIEFTVTYAWSLHLSIGDDEGVPMFNAIVRYDGDRRVASDESGLAVIGPLRSIDTVTFNTITDLIDYGLGPVAATGDTLPLTLLAWHPVDHEDCGTTPDADFLAFLRRVTRTDGIGDRSTLLRHWDHYPLSLWIQPAVSPNLGWDLDALAADAPGIWERALGETMFTAAADSASADVVVVFAELGGNYNGLTTMTLPAGDLGDEIPQRMLVQVRPSLDSNPGGTVEPYPLMITEVTLHELGHVLGFYDHICDSGQGNLMDFGGAIGSLAGGEAAAFHGDELALVRAVRHIPQLTDMAKYLRN